MERKATKIREEAHRGKTYIFSVELDAIGRLFVIKFKEEVDSHVGYYDLLIPCLFKCQPAI